MKNTIKLTALWCISLFMSACATTSYQQGDWTSSNKDRDWDIDSAVCLQKSEKFNADDLERVEQIKEDAQLNQDMAGMLEDANQYGTQDTGLTVVTTVLSLLAGSDKVTAEDTVRDEKFNKCLEDKSWVKE